MPSGSLDSLRAYQKRGIGWLTKAPVRILGDDTGLGKTLQCILAAEALKYDRLLVLCPLIGAVSWRIELSKWQLTKRAFHIYDKADLGVPKGPLVYLIPYSSLSVQQRRAHVLRILQHTAPFDAVIEDEAQYLSTNNSARTGAVYGPPPRYTGGIVQITKPKSVWVLSGTLQRRDVRDLFPHLRNLLPEVINQAMGRPDHAPIRKADYEAYFCDYEDDRFGRQITGNDAVTIPLLREALRPHVLIRRKRDVAPELGSIQMIDLPLGIDPDDPYAPAVSHPDFGRALVEELFSSVNLHTVMALSETAAEERRILGMIKVRPLGQWCVDFLDAYPEQKLVIFAWHRDVIAELEERLSGYGPVTLHGGTKAESRNDAVALFQTDPGTRVFIGQTIAASTSITLTAASTVITVEPDWLPHNDYQANSRVHRIGQTEPVLNYRCFADGTIDTRIFARARVRYADFEELVGALVETPVTKEIEHASPHHA